jgi:crotonobetainyl-CoA:carnitine CoA-transferase CaiB-like acyl-CoA transferase
MRSAGRNGTGVKADVSVMETMLSLHQSTFSRLAAGWVRARTGRYAEVYPLTVRPCRDGYVSLGVVTDEEFDRLAITFGLPELLADERFGSRQARMANCDALDKELERYLLFHDADSIVAALQASAVAAAKVVSPLGVLANPQLTQRRFWSRPRGAGGPVMPGNPLRRARTFAADPRPRAILEPPQFGLPSHRDATLPRAGMTVLDFTAYWAGPSATRALADFGAQVIWIERPRSRLDADPATGDPNDVQQYLYHQKMNRHKRSVALDLTTPVGRKAAKRLVASADVLVENFRPGVAIELGLDPALLCAANPQLVYISLSGFGSTGPWGAWRSFGPNLEAASAMLARTGYVGGEPMRLGHALPDGVGGIAGALAALRGLRERDATGRGGWFDISQLEVYTAISGEDIAEASVEGWDVPRIGNRSRTQGVIQGVFRCHGEDQWLALRLGGAEDVRRFSEAAGVLSLDLAGDAPVAEALIERYTATRDKWQLANALQSAGIEAFPVLLSNEFVHDPHLAERGFFVEVSSAGRHHIVPGTPIHSLPPLTDLAGVAPRFGEHTGQVLSALSAVS